MELLMRFFYALITVIVSISLPAVAQESMDTAEAPQSSWKNILEFSLANTTGNSETTAFASKFASEFDTAAHWKFYFDAFFTYVETDGSESANRLLLEAKTEYDLTAKLFLLLQADYTQDKFQGFDYRTTIGPGIGYRFWDSEAKSLKIFASATYRVDEFRSEGLPSEQYAALSGSIEYEQQLNENVTIGNDLDFHTQVDETDNYRIVNDLRLKVKLTSNLNLGVSYGVHYQNLPPTPAFKDLDTALLTSLIIDF